jgi:ATP phosphoribosyltransferase
MTHNHRDDAETLRLGLPSKGALAGGAMSLLKNAGLKVHKPNERQYSAQIPSLPGVEVIFQRATDVLHKVHDGTLDMGITGYDITSEYTGASDDVLVIRKLGFGGADLVIAVPESWLDVGSVADLADLAMLYKDKGRKLRVASTFHNLTRNWLFKKGITNFTLVNADGALEVAPRMGYADVIADLTATGTTLRENRLKEIRGGTILESEACLICNSRQLETHPAKLHLVKQMLELIEANIRAGSYVTLLANIRGTSADDVGERLTQMPELSGLIGPGVVEVYPKTTYAERWYEINIVIKRKNLLPTMEHLRDIGGKDITVNYPQYVFDARSELYDYLIDSLRLKKRT